MAKLVGRVKTFLSWAKGMVFEGWGEGFDRCAMETRDINDFHQGDE